MSYFLEGLQVLGGACLFILFMVLAMGLVLVVLERMPAKRHRPPRRVWRDWDELPQDRAVKMVRGDEIVMSFTSDASVPFDQDEWEARFADEGRV